DRTAVALIHHLEALATRNDLGATEVTAMSARGLPCVYAQRQALRSLTIVTRKPSSSTRSARPRPPEGAGTSPPGRRSRSVAARADRHVGRREGRVARVRVDVTAQKLGRRVLLTPELAIARLVAAPDAVRARRFDHDDVGSFRRGSRAGNEDGANCVRHHALGSRTHEEGLEMRGLVRPDDDEVGGQVGGDLHDLAGGEAAANVDAEDGTRDSEGR